MDMAVINEWVIILSPAFAAIGSILASLLLIARAFKKQDAGLRKDIKSHGSIVDSLKEEVAKVEAQNAELKQQLTYVINKLDQVTRKKRGGE